MNIDQAFPSKYLKAADLQGRDWDLEMASVSMEDVGDSDEKPVVYFRGCKKGLVLNVINKNQIKKLYGSETSHWVGKRIILFPTETDFRGETVDCIRIRSQPGGKATGGQASAPAEPAPQPAPDPQPAAASHEPIGPDDIPF